jgi:hypothetical protein
MPGRALVVLVVAVQLPHLAQGGPAAELRAGPRPGRALPALVAEAGRLEPAGGVAAHPVDVLAHRPSSLAGLGAGPPVHVADGVGFLVAHPADCLVTGNAVVGGAAEVPDLAC